jgi:hypothetical protein
VVFRWDAGNPHDEAARRSSRGLAVGYPDPDFPANKLRIGRDPVMKHVVFLDS